MSAMRRRAFLATTILGSASALLVRPAGPLHLYGDRRGEVIRAPHGVVFHGNVIENCTITCGDRVWWNGTHPVTFSNNHIIFTQRAAL